MFNNLNGESDNKLNVSIIDAGGLCTNVLDTIDNEEIAKLRKMVLSSLFIKASSSLGGTGVGVFFLIQAIKYSQYLSNIIILSGLGIVSLLFSAGTLINSLKRLNRMRNADYTNYQYGTVESKHRIKKRRNNKDIHEYYINVQFNDSFKFIYRAMILDPRVFYRLNEGDKALVITYDGIEAYAVEKTI